MGFAMVLLSLLALPVLMRFFTWTTGQVADSAGGGGFLQTALSGAVAIGALRGSSGGSGGSGAAEQARLVSAQLGPSGGGPGAPGARRRSPAGSRRAAPGPGAPGTAGHACGRRPTAPSRRRRGWRGTGCRRCCREQRGRRSGRRIGGRCRRPGRRGGRWPRGRRSAPPAARQPRPCSHRTAREGPSDELRPGAGTPGLRRVAPPARHRAVRPRRGRDTRRAGRPAGADHRGRR